MTPTQFFEKNLKWFAIGLLFLFLFKSVQSCNRNTQLNMGTKHYIEQIDSLKTMHNAYVKVAQDSITELNYLLRFTSEQTKAANERASAVQSAVEKIKSNTTTTVVVKGAEEVKDTIVKK